MHKMLFLIGSMMVSSFGSFLPNSSNNRNLEISNLPDLSNTPSVFDQNDFILVDLVSNAPGGGSPIGARYIRYTFFIEDYIIDNLQNYNSIYFSVPFQPENTNLGGFELELKNPDDTDVYNGVSAFNLSHSMLYHFGVTNPDDPDFMNGNIFKDDKMTNYKNSGINVTIYLTITYFPPTWYNQMLDGVSLYDRLIDIYASGYNNGYFDGNSDGYVSGYLDGYDQGASDMAGNEYQNGYNDGSRDSFMSNFSVWIVPAIFLVLVLGGVFSIMRAKRED